MDLALTPEQEMLKSAVSRFVQQEYPKRDSAGASGFWQPGSLRTLAQAGEYRLKRALVHTLQGNDTVADRKVASSVALGIDRGTLESLIESLVDGPKTWTGHCYYHRPRPPRIHSCSKLGSPRLDIRKTSR